MYQHKNKKNLKYAIIDTCKELDFELLNLEEIRSRRDYNKYQIQYPIYFKESGIKQYLLVETVFMVKAYPDERKKVSSLICDFWKEKGYKESIIEFEMEPFEIRVQTLERTFVDKVFAICDYSISNKISGHSRHIYDLYKLLSKISINEELKDLVKEVKEDRKKHEHCFSAQDSYHIPSLLKRIIDEKVYYKDYEDITRKVLYDDTSYETSIKVLYKIIESGLFE